MIMKWGDPTRQSDGHMWQYYLETKFAFAPMYMQGTLVWLQRYWRSWPVDLTTGKPVDLYRADYPFDPRGK